MLQLLHLKTLLIENGPYETWKGSPISEGTFQFDMWGVNTIRQMGVGCT